MSSDDLAALAMDAVLDVLGDDAVYLPLVGPIRTIRVFLRRPDRVIDGLGVTRLVNDGRIVEVERAALAVDPQPGDKLRIGPKVLLVRAARPSGVACAIWELDCDAS